MPEGQAGVGPGGAPARDTAAESGEDPTRWATGRLLSTAARLVEHRWNEGLATFGLTHAGFGVIAHLMGGPLSQHEIAGRTKVEDQTMSRTLDRLERQGHIARVQDAADRRRRLVSVTVEGRDAFTTVARSQLDRELVDQRIAEHCDLASFRAALLALMDPEDTP
jgi:MarR family transcriptional regulator, organic hydroperoxide resistance regulator